MFYLQLYLLVKWNRLITVMQLYSFYDIILSIKSMHFYISGVSIVRLAHTSLVVLPKESPSLFLPTNILLQWNTCIDNLCTAPWTCWYIEHPQTRKYESCNLPRTHGLDSGSVDCTHADVIKSIWCTVNSVSSQPVRKSSQSMPPPL